MDLRSCNWQLNNILEIHVGAESSSGSVLIGPLYWLVSISVRRDAFKDQQPQTHWTHNSSTRDSVHATKRSSEQELEINTQTHTGAGLKETESASKSV